MQNLIEPSSQLDVPKWQKFVIFAMIATALLTLWASLFAPILDGDIWFHMLYGKQILENHTLTPDHTLYSWTPSSNDHIYCAWLGEVIYYLSYKYAGDTGVIVIRYFTASTLFFALIHLAWQRKNLYNPLPWFAATLCILIISQSLLDKPEAISFALMSVMVWNWYEIKQLNTRLLYHVYLFPLLILVWVNTHGIFTFGCLFLLCIGVGETLNQLFYQRNALPRKTYYHLLLGLILSAGAIFITPYGYDYIHQLISQGFDQQRQGDLRYVRAFRSTFETGFLQLPLFANSAIVLLLGVFFVSLRKRQIDFVPIISNLLFAFLFTKYVRLAFLWVPVFSLSIAFYCSSIHFTQEKIKRAYIVTFSAATFLLSLWFIDHEKNLPSKERWLDFGLSESFTIEEELDFITSHYPHARLGTMYEHGAYILWKTWPQNQVMMDARYFPYKSWCNEYFTSFVEGKNIETFIKKYPFDIIEIKHSAVSAMQWFHNSSDWKLVFYGKGAAIFVRSGLAQPGETIRGAGLQNILWFATGQNVFTTTLLLHDWIGADIVLSTMKDKFETKQQQISVSGMRDFKTAAQAYEHKDYSASIYFLKQAESKKIENKGAYAAVLLMKSIENWKNKQWHSALKMGIEAMLKQQSFQATYNVALMALQIKTMEENGETEPLPLTEQEKVTISAWREALVNLMRQKEQLLPKYATSVENIEKILNGDVLFNTQFLEPEWL